MKTTTRTAFSQSPWSGIGRDLDHGISVEEVLNQAGLNWEVDKSPAMFVVDTYDKPIMVRHTDSCTLYRKDNNFPLDHVSDDWEPVQNRQAFEFIDQFVKAGDMTMDTAGQFQDGRIVWCLARLNQGAFEVFPGDEIKPYMLFTNFHKYGRATDIRLTPTRVSCLNSLMMALSNKGDLSFNLTHKYKFDPEVAMRALGVAKAKIEEYQSLTKLLASKRYTAESLISYFKDVFPSAITAKTKKGSGVESLSVPAKTAFDMINVQPGANFGEGTWWQAFNATTFVADHVLGKSQDTRLTSSWYGVNRQRKVNSANLAREYAMAA